ncbi:acyl carrier protein [Amycolatopsis saalfeldensis]|uniref:Acyl carrier protein n=1 Tax=Amycolatopsis saalfeldensis TaxID=394193 RepID=A0A1H8YLN0_9PSEU|nr:phosphopantetheine-binding protein [Amycolatopsis saalfeldensis]SEP53114.1 acyl carrier protein [Amycolatopsis saalfeldensis]
MSIETTAVDEVTVLARLSEMLRELLEEYGLDDTEITMDTTFHDDLELESVDLVALSGQLREHYGDRVNFAAFIAERDLDEIIALTIGELVRYIVGSLRAAP